MRMSEIGALDGPRELSYRLDPPGRPEGRSACPARTGYTPDNRLKRDAGHIRRRRSAQRCLINEWKAIVRKKLLKQTVERSVVDSKRVALAAEVRAGQPAVSAPFSTRP